MHRSGLLAKLHVTKLHLPCCLAGLLAVSLLSAAPADARRRIVGSGDMEDEDKVDAEAAAKEKKKREKAKKKKSKEAVKKAAARAKKKEERKKAKAAARAAAKEAAKKKKEATEAKARATVEKEKARLDGNKEERLLAAKKQRKISRRSGNLVFNLTLLPGAPKPGELLELRIDTFKELEVADVKFGKFKPLKKLAMTVQVSPPETGQQADGRIFRVHALRSPGSYGFHVTPDAEGEHSLRIEGKSDDDIPFTVEVALHVGIWPPPDFDGEEANNAKQKAGGSSGRRIVGGR